MVMGHLSPFIATAMNLQYWCSFVLHAPSCLLNLCCISFWFQQPQSTLDHSAMFVWLTKNFSPNSATMAAIHVVKVEFLKQCCGFQKQCRLKSATNVNSFHNAISQAVFLQWATCEQKHPWTATFLLEATLLLVCFLCKNSLTNSFGGGKTWRLPKIMTSWSLKWVASTSWWCGSDTRPR